MTTTAINPEDTLIVRELTDPGAYGAALHCTALVRPNARDDPTLVCGGRDLPYIELIRKLIVPLAAYALAGRMPTVDELAQIRLLSADPKLLKRLELVFGLSLSQRTWRQLGGVGCAIPAVKPIPAADIRGNPCPYLDPPAPIPLHDAVISQHPGIYFVWADCTVVYVGQSTNLAKRVRARHPRIHAGDLVSWLEFEPTELYYAESHYISTCRPTRNFGAERQRLQAYAHSAAYARARQVKQQRKAI